MMDSKQSMFEIQQQIKNNSIDLQSMVSDLADWADDQHVKEKTGQRGENLYAASQAKKGVSKKPLPPIRNRVDIKNSLQQSEKEAAAKLAAKAGGQKPKSTKEEELLAKVKRDTTPMPDYYKAWDKIGNDIDSEDSGDDNTGDATKAKNPKFREESKSTAEMFLPTSGAKPNTRIVVKGARQQHLTFAEESKLQGNAYFVSLDYSKAIECYTRCLNNIDRDAAGIQEPQEMRKLVLSNRSQAYLKLKAYAKAFDDANRAVLIDPTHVKSVGRRGTANYYLGRVKQAKIDFITAIKLDPENIGFLEYIKKTDERLNKLRSEAMEKMERRVMFTDLEEMGFDEHSQRVPITELHLDQKAVAEMQQKKEQVVNRQNQEPRILEGRHDSDDENEKQSAAATGKKANKKKNKKSRKNKGLAAFMDGDELKEFAKADDE